MHKTISPNRTNHTDNYLPLQIITQSELERHIAFGSWRNRIERKCQEISQLVSDDMYAQNYLEYAFREIIRNVFEHSGVDSCSIMAQSYRNGFIEIAIADRGDGIHHTLSDKFNTNSPLDSLMLSLKAGISRVDTEHSKGPWGNSGFGLYILSGVGKEYGEFSILSSGSYAKLYEEDKRVIIDEVFFKGTAIKINVHKESLQYFPNLRKKLIDDGENWYFENFGKEIKASTKSKKSARD